MLYQKICYVGLVLYATLSRTTFGSTYYAYTSNTTGCSSAGPDDRCIFLCDTRDWKQDFDCGNAGICDITCDQKQCLHSSTVTASNSFQLNVLARSVGAEEKCYKNTIFYLPNIGSANFSATTSSIDPFQEMVVNAGSNTNNIYINCGGGNKIDECKKMTVNAQTADFLYMNIADSNLNGDVNNIIAINCPQNATYYGPYDAPCYIDARNAVLQYVTINTQYGMPHDVVIEAYDANTWLDVSLTCSVIDNTLQVSTANILDESNGCWSTRAPITYSSTSTPTDTDSLTSVPSVSTSSGRTIQSESVYTEKQKNYMDISIPMIVGSIAVVVVIICVIFGCIIYNKKSRNEPEHTKEQKDIAFDVYNSNKTEEEQRDIKTEQQRVHETTKMSINVAGKKEEEEEEESVSGDSLMRKQRAYAYQQDCEIEAGDINTPLPDFDNNLTSQINSESLLMGNIMSDMKNSQLRLEAQKDNDVNGE